MISLLHHESCTKSTSPTQLSKKGCFTSDLFGDTGIDFSVYTSTRMDGRPYSRSRNHSISKSTLLLYSKTNWLHVQSNPYPNPHLREGQITSLFVLKGIRSTGNRRNIYIYYIPRVHRSNTVGDPSRKRYSMHSRSRPVPPSWPSILTSSRKVSYVLVFSKLSSSKPIPGM